MTNNSGTRIDRRLLISGASGALLAAQAGGAWAAGRGAPVVQTTAGAIRGATSGKVAVFKGVPYAASTAGAGRFRPPQKVTRWRGVREATSFGPICPQPNFPVLPEIDGSQPHTPQGEDCLLLNVWTPGLAGKAPVMVWFHGGGYTVGGGSAPWYDGHNLAARQGAVVVTINHRLNVFGFLYLDELAGPAFAGSGNAGMLDCVAALRWVRDNIARFGGDPGNVTIFGESGGAGKVSTLMAMPSAKGLFHRAIAESGAALKHGTREQATKAARALLDVLGLQPSDAARLQSLPVEDILAAMAKVRVPGAFNPVVDGVAIPHDPFDPTAPMVSADVPFMTGSNLTEATFFPDTPLDPIEDAALLSHVKGYTHTDDDGASHLIALCRAENPGRDNVFVYQIIASEYWMRAGVLLQAERKAALHRGRAYVYQFNRLSPARGGKLHCPHGSEIPYAFDNLATAPDLVGPPARGQALANRMSAAWVAFARTGDPSVPGGLHWPAYGAGRAVMVFDEHSRVEADPGGKLRAAIAALKGRQA